MADADEDMEIIEEIKHKPATAEEIWGDTSCSFCSKKLTTIESDPKLLTCLHAACMNCIQSNAVGDNVTCPGCSQVCQLNDIVDHQFVIELKQGSSSNSEAEKNVTCSCGDNAQAFSYCKDCQDWLCDECVSAHQRVRFTKDHVIKNKEEIDVSDVNGRQVAGQPRYLQCPTHKNELLKLYCESCDKLTCRDCQLVEHKDHKYQFLSNVSQQYKSFLTTLLTKIREKSSYIDSAQALVKKRQAEILEREDEVTKEIKVFAVQIITLINQRGKQLLQELHETCEKKKDQLTVKNEELVNLSLKLEHCLKFADSAVKESSDSALVYSKKHITNQLRHVLHKRCEVPNPQHVVDIRFMYDSKYLPEYINKVGQIVVDQQSNNRTGNRSLNQGGSAAPFIQKPPSYVGFGQQPNQAPTQTSPQRRPSPPVHYNQGRGVPAQGYQANKPYTPRANQNIHDLNKSRSQVINYQQIRPRMQQHQSPRLQSQHSQVTAPQQQQQPQQHRQQPVHSNSSVTILPVSSANNANVPNGFQQRNDSNVRIVNVQSLQARNIRQQSPQQVTPKVISVTSMSTNQMQSRPLNNMSLSMTNTQRLTHYSGNNNSAAMLQQNVQPSPSRHQSPQQSRVGQPQQLRVLELGKNANASAMMQQKAPAQTNLVNHGQLMGMPAATRVDSQVRPVQMYPANVQQSTFPPNINDFQWLLASEKMNEVPPNVQILNKQSSNQQQQPRYELNLPASSCSGQPQNVSQGNVNTPLGRLQTLLQSNALMQNKREAVHQQQPHPVTKPTVPSSPISSTTSSLSCASSSPPIDDKSAVAAAIAKIKQEKLDDSQPKNTHCSSNVTNVITTNTAVNPSNVSSSSFSSKSFETTTKNSEPCVSSNSSKNTETIDRKPIINKITGAVMSPSVSQPSSVSSATIPMPPPLVKVTSASSITATTSCIVTVANKNVGQCLASSGESKDSDQVDRKPVINKVTGAVISPVVSQPSSLPSPNVSTAPPPVKPATNLPPLLKPVTNIPPPVKPATNRLPTVNPGFPPAIPDIPAIGNVACSSSSLPVMPSTSQPSPVIPSMTYGKSQHSALTLHQQVTTGMNHPMSSVYQQQHVASNFAPLHTPVNNPAHSPGYFQRSHGGMINSMDPKTPPVHTHNSFNRPLNTPGSYRMPAPSYNQYQSVNVTQSPSPSFGQYRSGSQTVQNSSLAGYSQYPISSGNLPATFQRMANPFHAQYPGGPIGSPNNPNAAPTQSLSPLSNQINSPGHYTAQMLSAGFNQYKVGPMIQQNRPIMQTPMHPTQPFPPNYNRFSRPLNPAMISSSSQSTTADDCSGLKNVFVPSQTSIAKVKTEPLHGSILCDRPQSSSKDGPAAVTKSLNTKRSQLQQKSATGLMTRLINPNDKLNITESEKVSDNQPKLISNNDLKGAEKIECAINVLQSICNEVDENLSQNSSPSVSTGVTRNYHEHLVPQEMKKRQLSVAIFNVVRSNILSSSDLLRLKYLTVNKSTRREMRRRERMLRRKEKLLKVRRKRSAKASSKDESDNSDAGEDGEIPKKKLFRYEDDPDWKKPNDDFIELMRRAKRPANILSPAQRHIRRIRSVHTRFEKMIYTKLCELSKTEVKIDKQTIMNLAKEFSDELGIQNFVCNDEWYDKFYEKHNIRSLLDETLDNDVPVSTFNVISVQLTSTSTRYSTSSVSISGEEQRDLDPLRMQIDRESVDDANDGSHVQEASSITDDKEPSSGIHISDVNENDTLISVNRIDNENVKPSSESVTRQTSDTSEDIKPSPESETCQLSDTSEAVKPSPESATCQMSETSEDIKQSPEGATCQMSETSEDIKQSPDGATCQLSTSSEDVKPFSDSAERETSASSEDVKTFSDSAERETSASLSPTDESSAENSSAKRSSPLPS